MNETERQARRNAVAAIAKLSYAYGKEMPDEQIDIYIDALHDLPSEDLNHAVNVVISTEKYFPAIATIRQAALADPSQLSPEEAWSAVLERIRQYGRAEGAGDVTTPIRAAINACGGWSRLCESTNPVGDRITFVNAYKAHVDRSFQQAATRWHRSDNTSPESIGASLKELHG